MIAVLLATYNGTKYLPELFDSLFNQTCQDFTVYVHDDGSKDNTCDIIAEYSKMYPERVQILWGPPTGSPKANFMWMMSQVEAPYYMFCDQDDVWAGNKVEKSMEAMIAIEQDSYVPTLVFSDMTVVDEQLKVTQASFVGGLGRSVRNTRFTQVLIDNPAAGCTMLFNNALKEVALGCPDIDAIPMHDVWMLLMADIFGKVTGLEDRLVRYRQTGDNIMGAGTEDDIDKVSRNASDIKSGSFLQKKREFVQSSKDLAKVLLMMDKLPAKVRLLLKDYVEIGSKPKLARIYFYKKNKFERARNNAWYYMWI